MCFATTTPFAEHDTLKNLDYDVNFAYIWNSTFILLLKYFVKCEGETILLYPFLSVS